MITFQGRHIPESYGKILRPSHTTLIVHEMLNDFTALGGAFDKQDRRGDLSNIIPPIVKVLEAARQLRVKIIYVRFTRFADYRTYSDPMVVKEYDRISNSNFVHHVLHGTWGWENIVELKPQKDDVVIPKFRVDSFIGTNLDMVLRSNDIKAIVVVGFGAEVGILPTVCTAFNLGYFAAVPEDCISAASPSWSSDAKKFIARFA